MENFGVAALPIANRLFIVKHLRWNKNHENMKVSSDCFAICRIIGKIVGNSGKNNR